MHLDVARIVVACGGRNYSDKETVRGAVQDVSPTLLIHGNASGADTLAGIVAHELNIPVIAVPANWAYYATAAGPRRNAFQADLADYMIDPEKECDGVVPTLLAFPGGRGTAGMISIARQRFWNVLEIT